MMGTLIQKVKKIIRNLVNQIFLLLGTIVNWLHLLGFKVTETKKGIYFDG